MRKTLLAGLVLVSAVLAGCSSGQPRAVTPETSWDFGDVPVSNDMSKAERKQFFIRNEGTAPLKIKDVQMKLLQGC